jgi:hypothetical protein
MSMPRICQTPPGQYQDILMHIIYSGGAEPLLRFLIAESLKNIAEDFPTPGVRAALASLAPAVDTPLAGLRARFFLLLNQDQRMRVRLCHGKISAHLAPVCAYKACCLYAQLSESVVPAWIKNETITLLDLVDHLKDAYLVA